MNNLAKTIMLAGIGEVLNDKELLELQERLDMKKLQVDMFAAVAPMVALSEDEQREQFYQAILDCFPEYVK